MSDKLCLQWNDFQKNVANAFRNLREDKEFADMTLVCEDGNQIEVHKVILSSSSLEKEFIIDFIRVKRRKKCDSLFSNALLVTK